MWTHLLLLYRVAVCCLVVLVWVIRLKKNTCGCGGMRNVLSSHTGRRHEETRGGIFSPEKEAGNEEEDVRGIVFSCSTQFWFHIYMHIYVCVCGIARASRIMHVHVFDFVTVVV